MNFNSHLSKVFHLARDNKKKKKKESEMEILSFNLQFCKLIGFIDEKNICGQIRQWFKFITFTFTLISMLTDSSIYIIYSAPDLDSAVSTAYMLVAILLAIIQFWIYFYKGNGILLHFLNIRRTVKRSKFDA